MFFNSGRNPFQLEGFLGLGLENKTNLNQLCHDLVLNLKTNLFMFGYLKVCTNIETFGIDQKRLFDCCQAPVYVPLSHQVQQSP